MQLHELDEDVLILILSLLDITTVLSVSQANKDLRYVALGRSVWISLVAHLADRGILALPPPEVLAGYTSDDLIAEVKRLVVGPETWAKGGTEAATHREYTWRLKEPPSTAAAITVLSGGRYVVVHDAPSLDLWESTTGRHIWASSGSITTWAVTFSDRGQTAHMVLFRSSPQCSAEVVRINLASGESDTVFDTIVGIVGTDEFRKATIIGDYFAVSSPRRGQTTHRILVINWRAETFAFLRCPRSLEAGPALIPGHITLTFSGHISYDEQVVSVWPLASFAWLPIVQTPAFAHFPTDMETQPPLASTRIRLGFHGARHPPRVELSVLQNPLRHGTYKVILYTTYRRSENEPHDELRPALPGTEGPILPRLESDLRCFSLCLPTSNLSVELRQLSTAPARLFLRDPCVSYSGHCIIPRMLSIVVAEVCSTCEAVEWLNSWEVEPRGQRACVALSLAPYGGVVATLGYINAKVTHFL